jgi:hypothetical protein
VRLVRSSDTRDAFVEARPGRKKISRNLLHAISPHSSRPHPPRVFIIFQHRLRAVTFRFCSLHVELQLLADRQVVFRGCRRIITLATRLAVLYKQIYSPLHGPQGRTPRVWKTTPYHPAARKAIRFIHPIYYRHHRCDQFSDLLQSVSFQSLPRAV